jgi:hypothetical protein
MIMATSRAGKLVFGAIFVLSSVLFAAYSFAADEDLTEAEAIPTPAAVENGNTHVPATENSNIITEECDENGCTFGGVPLCSPPGRFWVRSDWIMWWTSGAALPPLVTNSPSPTTQQPGQAGALGQPGTTIVFGDSTVYNDGRAGVRIAFGGWLDKCHRYGLEADWMTLGGKSISFSQTSNGTSSVTGNPIVSRPFFNVQSNAEDSEPVAYPGLVTGTVSVSGNDYFESVGATLRYNLCCNSCEDLCQASCGDECGGTGCDPCSLYYCRTDLLLGYRNYVLGDNLTIHEDLVFVDTNNLITDSFRTRNEFHGAEIGLNTQLRRGRWSLDFLTKMALGSTRQSTTIHGSTTFIQTGAALDFPGVGIYAGPTNSVTPTTNQFSVIPQLGLEMGYQLTCRARVYVGYNVIYWATVKRAGEQIDRNIDPSNWAPIQEGALPFPAYQARQTSFWAQGLNVGAEFRF